MGANFTQNALPYVAAGLSLESGDTSGLMNLLQNQQKAREQAQQNAAFQTLVSNDPNLKLSPTEQQALGQLPGDQRISYLNSRRQEETARATQQRQLKADERADKTLDVTQKTLGLKQQEAADKKAKDAEFKTMVDTQVTNLQPAIDALPATDKLRAQALMTTARKTGDFSKVSQLLAPEKPKAGTPAHLFQEARLGNVQLADPASVDAYFTAQAKNTAELKAAKAAAANFKKSYYATPEDKRSFFESLYTPAPKPELNAQALAQLQGQAPALQAPASAAPTQGAPTDTIRIERGGKTGTILRKDLKPTDKVL